MFDVLLLFFYISDLLDSSSRDRQETQWRTWEGMMCRNWTLAAARAGIFLHWVEFLKGKSLDLSFFIYMLPFGHLPNYSNSINIDLKKKKHS